VPRAKSKSPSSDTNHSSKILFLIAIFKLLKGLALIAVGIGVLHLMHRDIEQTVMHWVNMLRIDPENHWIHRILARIFRVSPKQLRAISLGTFLYAGLFLTEGTGLLLRKRWAEYFTIITTSSLLPLELYELVKHFTPAKLMVTIANVAIVAYLVYSVHRNK
jgi:uncharacterized membrane protein (DUF2068 family)